MTPFSYTPDQPDSAWEPFDPASRVVPESLQSLAELPGGSVVVVGVAVAPTDRAWSDAVCVRVAELLGTQSGGALLVDLDTANTTLHNVLGVPTRLGISDVLVAEASDLSPWSQPVEGFPFRFVPVGRGIEARANMLGHEAWAMMLRKERTTGTAVVLHVPLAADGVDSILTHADAVVLLGRPTDLLAVLVEGFEGPVAWLGPPGAEAAATTSHVEDPRGDRSPSSSSTRHWFEMADPGGTPDQASAEPDRLDGDAPEEPAVTEEFVQQSSDVIDILFSDSALVSEAKPRAYQSQEPSDDATVTSATDAVDRSAETEVEAAELEQEQSAEPELEAAEPVLDEATAEQFEDAIDVIFSDPADEPEEATTATVESVEEEVGAGEPRLELDETLGEAVERPEAEGDEEPEAELVEQPQAEIVEEAEAELVEQLEAELDVEVEAEVDEKPDTEPDEEPVAELDEEPELTTLAAEFEGLPSVSEVPRPTRRTVDPRLIAAGAVLAAVVVSVFLVRGSSAPPTTGAPELAGAEPSEQTASFPADPQAGDPLRALRSSSPTGAGGTADLSDPGAAPPRVSAVAELDAAAVGTEEPSPVVDSRPDEGEVTEAAQVAPRPAEAGASTSPADPLDQEPIEPPPEAAQDEPSGAATAGPTTTMTVGLTDDASTVAAQQTESESVQPPPAEATGVATAPPPNEGPSGPMAFGLEVGQHVTLAAARAQANELRAQASNILVSVVPIDQGSMAYRVVAGGAATRTDAEALQASLAAAASGDRVGEVRSTRWTYLLGAFEDYGEAAALAATADSQGIPAYLVEIPVGEDRRIFRVYSGAFATEQEAAALGAMLEGAGFTPLRLTERTGRPTR